MIQKGKKRSLPIWGTSGWVRELPSEPFLCQAEIGCCAPRVSAISRGGRSSRQVAAPSAHCGCFSLLVTAEHFPPYRMPRSLLWPWPRRSRYPLHLSSVPSWAVRERAAPSICRALSFPVLAFATSSALPGQVVGSTQCLESLKLPRNSFHCGGPCPVDLAPAPPRTSRGVWQPARVPQCPCGKERARQAWCHLPLAAGMGFSIAWTAQSVSPNPAGYLACSLGAEGLYGPLS